jgi:hypothetical protein
MTDRNEQIKEFAAKNNLTEAEAQLVYGAGDPEQIMLNFAMLQEIKTGRVHDAKQVYETDLERQSQDLLHQADEALAAGDTAKSIRLRRQAFDKKK